MTAPNSHRLAAFRGRWRIALPLAAVALTGSVVAAMPASAAAHNGSRTFDRPWFLPGNLVVSTTTYEGQASLFTPGVTELPPGCTTGCAAATSNGTSPGVFNNVLADPAFGVASPIYLDQITPAGRLINALRVPDGDGPFGGRPTMSSPASPRSPSLR